MKKKIPFDISYREKIESGEAELTTDDGRRVRVLAWDVVGDRPIVAAIQADIPDSGRETVVCYSADGMRQAGPGPSDLALLVDCEFTEFEERLGQIMIPTWDETKECGECQGDVDDVRLWARELLELARKELRQEFDEELEQAYKNQDDVVFRKGYEAGFLAASEIDMEKLTDQIAEKVAAAILKGGNPFAPNPAVPYPGNPDPGNPFGPVTVMYGCTPTEFRTTANQPGGGAASAATYATGENDEK